MKKKYMEDEYIKELESKVTKTGNNWITVAENIFYPKSGGQPSDKGKIVWDENESEVERVLKKSGEERIHLNGKIPEKGEKVLEKLDWDRRYNLMRMHSAQHLLSAIILNEYGAETAGNQIHEERSRIDLKPFDPTEEQLQKVRNKFNQTVRNGVHIKHYEKERKKVLEEVEEARRRLFERIPSSIEEIRVVEIEGIDKCPCAGTHVENTEEIGEIAEMRTESKGKDVTRIEYELEEI